MPDAAGNRSGAPLRPADDNERALVRAARDEARLMTRLTEVREKRDAAIYTLLRSGVRPARIAKLAGKTRGLMTRYVRTIEKEKSDA